MILFPLTAAGCPVASIELLTAPECEDKEIGCDCCVCIFVYV